MEFANQLDAEAKMSGRKSNTLSLKEKIELIKCSENEELSVKELIVKFKCGKTQVYEILRNKDRIKDDWFASNRNSGSKRRMRTTGYEKVNSLVYDWFVDARSRNLPISGPILRTHAKVIAERLGKPNFKASTGWLESFRLRHNIAFKQVSGDAKDTDSEAVKEWKIKLKDLIKDYEPANIANCDEMGLFYRALPNKTLLLKSEKCVGGTHANERLTVLVCGFANGKLEKPLVIGKSMRPSCFKGVSVNRLPVVWRANKEAWITASIMEQWLNALNQKMKIQNRKILMFLDNATCHPHLELSNIKLCFFPPNTTSAPQPLCQGVVQNLKVHYRKHVLQSLVANIEGSTSVTELARKISVLDAVRWLASACKNVSSQSVKNGFAKAGFTFESDVQNEEHHIEDAIFDLQILLEETGHEYVSAEDYAQIDQQLATEHGFQTLDELIQSREEPNEVKMEEESDGEGLGVDIEDADKITDTKSALRKLTALEEYVQRTGSRTMLQKFLELRTMIEEQALLIKKPKIE